VFVNMNPDKVKDILGIAGRVKQTRNEILSQPDLTLGEFPKITLYAPVKGKKPLAAQNAIDYAVKSILSALQTQLNPEDGSVVNFPIQLTVYTKREALCLLPASWEETGLGVEVAASGVQPTGKKDNWFLSAKVTMEDVTKPLAKACIAIIAARQAKAHFVEECEMRFAAAAEKIHEVIMNSIPDLIRGDIDEIVMPLYLRKKGSGYGSWHPEVREIKRVPSLFNPPEGSHDFLTSQKLCIQYSPLHVVKLPEEK
jgi:hypothetical protein